MTKKEEFEIAFERAIGRETLSYLIMVIQRASGAKEVVVNSDDLARKLNYYLSAYDDNLVLKNDPKIKIVGYLIV